MRRHSLAMLTLTLFAAGAAGADEAKPITVELSWRITLDAQGHVTQIDSAKKQPVDKVPQIRARLEQEIRGWKFTSGTINGQAAATETGLNVWATLLPKDSDSLVIRVDNASTGVSLAKVIPPRYPEAAVGAHKTGQVVLRIGYDSSGKVTSAELEPGAPGAPDMLVRAAMKAVRSWTFQPELVGAYARPGFAVTPFCFQLVRLGTHNVEGKCEWQKPGSSESVGEGQALALDPAARLQTDVAGHAL